MGFPFGLPGQPGTGNIHLAACAYNAIRKFRAASPATVGLVALFPGRSSKRWTICCTCVTFSSAPRTGAWFMRVGQPPPRRKSTKSESP